jgi:hypothetical protein
VKFYILQSFIIMYFKLLVSYLCFIVSTLTSLNQTWLGYSLGGTFSKIYLTALPCIQDGIQYY